MEHLKNEDIVKFVTLKKLNDETDRFCGRVNAHLCECPECRQKVRETRRLYDALNGIYGRTASVDTELQAGMEFDEEEFSKKMEM